MARITQPFDQANKVILRHRRASRRGTADSTANVKKYRAPLARHRWIGIMADLNQPTIAKVVMPHILFFKPRGRMSRILDGHESVIIGASHIIHPRIRQSDLAKPELRPWGKLRIVGVNFADSEDAGGSTTVALFFSQASFILTSQTPTPRDSAFAEEDGDRPTDRGPCAATLSPFKQPHFAAHGIPSRRNRHDELGALVGHTVGTGIADQQAQPQDNARSNCRDYHSHT
ncbi:MAG: hypothetical protein JWO45_245 [Spartobacteria bacterium]|nr:hypothetical protein [Spartobacteria bacterium]